MLRHLGSAASDRKVRLFQVACCRRNWDLLPTDACRAGVLVAECYADGATGDRQRHAAVRAVHAGPGSPDLARRRAGSAVVIANSKTVRTKSVFLGLAGAVGEAARVNRGVGAEDPYQEAVRAERAAEADLVRDIFGNPFRPVTADPRWLTSTVVQLAAGAYADRAFDRLPILADALQDVGCDTDDVLAHCRDPRATHVRGCWVVDLLMGKT
jgi:hypothetical protein